MTVKPRSVGLKSRPDLAGWAAVVILAAGGLLGSWLSYERGAATKEVEITNLKEETHGTI